MNTVGKGIAIIVFGLGIVSLLVAPAASQERREKETAERKPDNLWRIYPLDPEEGRKGQMPGTQIDAPVPVPPSRANDGESGGQGEVAREDEVSSSPSLLLLAITLGCAGALLVILAVRRALRPAPSAQATNRSIRTVSEAHPASETAPTQGAADLPAEMPSGLNLVRVHLRDGHKVEGAVKHVSTGDSPVLLLDVVNVSDAEGQKRDPEPFDAFVSLVEVERIESIDDTDARGHGVTGAAMSPSGPATSRLQPSSAQKNSAEETAEEKGA
jgi:hypothetical protein